MKSKHLILKILLKQPTSPVCCSLSFWWWSLPTHLWNRQLNTPGNAEASILILIWACRSSHSSQQDMSNAEGCTMASVYPSVLASLCSAPLFWIVQMGGLWWALFSIHRRGNPAICYRGEDLPRQAWLWKECQALRQVSHDITHVESKRWPHRNRE